MENYAHKKELISQLNILRIVTPSSWLANLVRDSFLKIFPVAVINNGVNLKQFYPRSTGELLQRYRLGNRKVVLGVASIWNERKGLKYLVGLIDYLPADAYQIIIIGVTKAQKKRLPPEIIGIERTESIDELAQFYSLADVYVNPTLEDNFPTTNLEALANVGTDFTSTIAPQGCSLPIASTLPPVLNVTTGVPQANASRFVVGKLSSNVGLTYTSANE